MASVDADVLAPLESLLVKCEKSQARLGPGTWQHAMLGRNIEALRLALARLQGEADPQGADPAAAGTAIDRMLERVAVARGKAKPGTAQRTLQDRRHAALLAARKAL